jgi:nitrite reductase (NADH) small subunit
MTWIPVCPYDLLRPESGVTALIGDDQVAIFLGYDGSLFAIDNLDPCSGAHVLSRGIVGTRGDVTVVSSPMHKQAFDLRTGRCLDVEGTSVRTHPIRKRGGMVEVGRLS